MASVLGFNLDLLPDAFVLISDAAKAYLPVLVPYATKLLGVAVLISGSWLLIKESLTNSPRNAIAALMLLVMQAAIALAFITNWKLLAGIAYGFQTDLAAILGGAGGAMAVVMEPLSTAMGKMVSVWFTSPLPAPPSDAGILDKLLLIVSKSIEIIVTTPIAIALTIVSLLLMGLTAALLGGAIMFAEISLAIGLVAAPLMIALNFMPFFNFTIDGLARFLLGAVILKLVAMLTALLLGGALPIILKDAFAAPGEYSERAAAMVFAVILFGAFLYVAMKVDDIARALMSGGVVGGPGARVVGGAMQQAAGAASKGALGAAATGAQAAAGGSLGAVKGAVGGGIRGAASGAQSGAAASVAAHRASKKR